jgi:hypothetical protein
MRGQGVALLAVVRLPKNVIVKMRWLWRRVGNET